jgi:Initiation factor 2 subunit family
MHAWHNNNRPYNQGARLTAFEMVEDKLPGTLITDSMASFLMAQGNVNVVVTGVYTYACIQCMLTTHECSHSVLLWYTHYCVLHAGT